MTQAPDLTLSLYIAEARGCPELSREEELALTQRWFSQCDNQAREELVRAHLRYAPTQPRKWRQPTPT
jgi:DNA-directed RNA polymerase sigma subunit (sigma70/sigma32)